MGQIIIHVVPGASSRSLEFPSDAPSGRSNLANAPRLKARLPDQAEDGRANRALIKWLWELGGQPVQIVRGATSHRKTIAFASSPDEFLAALREGLAREHAKKG